MKRHFQLENPLSLQLGLDWTERYRARRYDYHAWTFVGGDGAPGTADDTARHMAADHLPRRPDSQYSIPGTERISMSKLYSLYQRNPTWFQYDAERSALRSLTDGASYDLTETITAPYLEFNWLTLGSRLRLNGGVRYEKTEATATGLLTDNSAAYMKYANGWTVQLNDRDAAGNLLVRKLTTNANVADYVLAFAPTVLPTVRSGAPIFNAQIQAAGNALRAAGKTTDTATNLGRATLLHTSTVFKRKGATNSGGNDAYYPSLHATSSLIPAGEFRWPIPGCGACSWPHSPSRSACGDCGIGAAARSPRGCCSLARFSPRSASSMSIHSNIRSSRTIFNMSRASR